MLVKFHECCSLTLTTMGFDDGDGGGFDGGFYDGCIAS